MEFASQKFHECGIRLAFAGSGPYPCLEDAPSVGQLFNSINGISSTPRCQPHHEDKAVACFGPGFRQGRSKAFCSENVRIDVINDNSLRQDDEQNQDHW